MNADVKSRFRAGAKVCSGVIMVLLLIAVLGPAKWAPRTELGWQFDHFIGYFGITLIICLAWPRPLLVGGIITVVAALLEGLQALTPDRSANLEAALWGAGGLWRRLSLRSSRSGFGGCARVGSCCYLTKPIYNRLFFESYLGKNCNCSLSSSSNNACAYLMESAN
jgi:hypothetical protein